jgi:hypothetical protein
MEITSQSQAQSHFRNVLLVVRYNNAPSFKQVVTHHRLFSQVFQHQYVSLYWDSAELERFLRTEYYLKNQNTLTIDSAVPYDHYKKRPNRPTGNFAYRSMLKAMERFPQYPGYLFTHDDMAMNVSHLMTLSLDSLWHEEFGEPIRLENDWNSAKHSLWALNVPFGMKAIKELVQSNLTQQSQQRTCSVYDWGFGQSDFWYIPQKEREAFQHVMSEFSHFELFLEIAVPTFMQCYAPETLKAQLQLCTDTNWGAKKRSTFDELRQKCGDAVPLYHPIKTSNSNNVKYMFQKMNLSWDGSSIVSIFEPTDIETPQQASFRMDMYNDAPFFVVVVLLICIGALVNRWVRK